MQSNLSPVNHIVPDGIMSLNKKALASHNVFLLPAGFSGCAFWRFRMPFGKLQKLGSRLNITIADNANKIIRMNDIQEHLEHSELVSLQAPGYRDALTLMKLYRSENKKVVIDYDDYSFDLSPGNPRYSELGTRETDVMDENGKIAFRWRDGENGFDLKANIAKYEAFKECVRSADLITTTTEYLADKFRVHNPNVAVCPNSIDFDRWRPIRRPQELKNQVRIGWFGGDSHYVDLKIFKNLFPRLCKKYPQVRIVIQAPPMPEWRDFFKEIPMDQLEWYGWADLRYYMLFLASRHFDIGLCPLDANEFNYCKSNIKYLEFAALGAAVVAQDIIPYSNTIRNGETGLLASTEDQWFDSISKLVEDASYRNSVAMKGYLEARQNWDLDKNCRIWEKNYLDLLEGNTECGSNSEPSFRQSPQKSA